MAYLRLGHIKEASGHNKSIGLRRAIEYIFNPLKTNDRKYIGGYNMHLQSDDCDKMAYKQMLETKRLFGKEGGRQGYHYKLSFALGDEVSPELALRITDEFCRRCFTDYECAYAVHTNKKHLHSHIVFNSIDMIEGYKYHYKKGDWAKKIQPVVNSICEEYGLSSLSLNIDENLEFTAAKKEKRKCQPYNIWMRDNKKTTDRTIYTNNMIRRDVDECIAGANSYDEFIELMIAKGHVVDDAHMHLTVLAPGRTKRTRLYSLTPDKRTYTRENIKKMIVGKYVALDMDKVKTQMLGDWREYLASKNMVKIKIVNISMAKLMEMDRLAASKNLNADNIHIYKAYLNEVDKRLNIIRKYINKSLDARMEVLAALDEMLPLIKYYRRYKQGEYRFEAEYNKVIDLYNKITSAGYSVAALYKYRIQSQMMLSSIKDYKKHIYVETKITERIEKEIKKNKDNVDNLEKEAVAVSNEEEKVKSQNPQNPKRL